MDNSSWGFLLIHKLYFNTIAHFPPLATFFHFIFIVGYLFWKLFFLQNDYRYFKGKVGRLVELFIVIIYYKIVRIVRALSNLKSKYRDTRFYVFEGTDKKFVIREKIYITVFKNNFKDIFYADKQTNRFGTYFSAVLQFFRFYKSISKFRLIRFQF